MVAGIEVEGGSLRVQAAANVNLLLFTSKQVDLSY